MSNVSSKNCTFTSFRGGRPDSSQREKKSPVLLPWTEISFPKFAVRIPTTLSGDVEREKKRTDKIMTKIEGRNPKLGLLEEGIFPIVETDMFKRGT